MVIGATVPKTFDVESDRRRAMAMIDIQTVERHHEIWPGRVSTDAEYVASKMGVTYACTGCGHETIRAIAGDTPVFVSRASTHLRSLEIFNFSPDAGKTPLHHPTDGRPGRDLGGTRRTG